MINYSFNLKIKNREILKTIIERKHSGVEKTELENCQNQILRDYVLYLKNRKNLEKMHADSSLSDRQKDIMKKTYKANPVELQKAKRLIKNGLPSVLNAKCPYCLLSEHNTFDHYFDKATFPEYSIFAPNLIPCCSKCNSKKGNLFLDGRGKRYFIHFIFDKIPDYPFLVYKIGVNNRKIVLEDIVLDFSREPSNPLNDSISNQFSKLELKKRLAKEFSSYVSQIVMNYELNPKNKAETINNMKEIIVRLEKQCGINHWQTAIYRGLLANDKVIDLLSK